MTPEPGILAVAGACLGRALVGDTQLCPSDSLPVMSPESWRTPCHLTPATVSCLKHKCAHVSGGQGNRSREPGGGLCPAMPRRTQAQQGAGGGSQWRTGQQRPALRHKRRLRAALGSMETAVQPGPSPLGLLAPRASPMPRKWPALRPSQQKSPLAPQLTCGRTRPGTLRQTAIRLAWEPGTRRPSWRPWPDVPCLGPSPLPHMVLPAPPGTAPW